TSRCRTFAAARFTSVSIGALALASAMSPAFAQSGESPGNPPNPPPGLATAASAESAGTDSQSIIVTGSRLARSTFDTPSPVTVLGGEDFERLQITNVGEGVSELPSFRPSNNPSTNGFGSFNVGAQIVNL